MEASFHEGREQNWKKEKGWQFSCVSATFVHDDSVTLLLAKWIFMNYRTILNILNANENPEIPDTQEMTRF